MFLSGDTLKDPEHLPRNKFFNAFSSLTRTQTNNNIRMGIECHTGNAIGQYWNVGSSKLPVSYIILGVV